MNSSIKFTNKSTGMSRFKIKTKGYIYSFLNFHFYFLLSELHVIMGPKVNEHSGYLLHKKKILFAYLSQKHE